MAAGMPYDAERSVLRLPPARSRGTGVLVRPSGRLAGAGAGPGADPAERGPHPGRPRLRHPDQLHPGRRLHRLRRVIAGGAAATQTGTCTNRTAGSALTGGRGGGAVLATAEGGGGGGGSSYVGGVTAGATTTGATTAGGNATFGTPGTGLAAQQTGQAQYTGRVAAGGAIGTSDTINNDGDGLVVIQYNPPVLLS